MLRANVTGNQTVIKAHNSELQSLEEAATTEWVTV